MPVSCSLKCDKCVLVSLHVCCRYFADAQISHVLQVYSRAVLSRVIRDRILSSKQTASVLSREQSTERIRVFCINAAGDSRRWRFVPRPFGSHSVTVTFSSGSLRYARYARGQTGASLSVQLLRNLAWHLIYLQAVGDTTQGHRKHVLLLIGRKWMNSYNEAI